MRYLLLMNYAEPAPGEIPDEAIQETQDAFGAYGRALQEAGVLVAAEVLTPTASASTLTLRRGPVEVQDGPFAETKEALAGVFVLDVPDLTPPSAGPRSAPAHSSASWRSGPAGRRSSRAPGLRPAPCDRTVGTATAEVDGGARRAALVRAELAARTSYGRLLALLAAGTSDIAGAEDALADAFERALRSWPVDGIPDRPDAWLLTVARNRQRDHWRSAEASRTTPLDPATHAPRTSTTSTRMPCQTAASSSCWSARTRDHRHRPHPAHAQHRARLHRRAGRPQLRRACPHDGHPAGARQAPHPRQPHPVHAPRPLASCRDRMDAVLAAVYAAYVIEWSTGPGERDLPPEALHLAEVLAELAPDDPEVRGLAALVELSAARRPGRHRRRRPVRAARLPGPEPWDAVLIARAHDHLRAAHPARVIGRYQLEAAVQAVHCARRETGRTDWPTLLELHRSLAVVAPSLGSATALAAVTAEVEGPASGLALLDADAGRTVRFQPAWATRAELLARLGRTTEALDAYDHAIALTHETPERRHLEARRAALRP